MNLSILEIKDLINRYQSEVSKLEFQLARTRQTIEELKTLIPKKKAETAAALAALKNSSESGTASQERMQDHAVNGDAETLSYAQSKNYIVEERAVSALESAMSKAQRRNARSSGYRLSAWDMVIINGIEKAQRPLTNTELFTLFREKRDTEGLNGTDDQLRGRLNRSLHKLANKRGILVKMDKEGRGFAYGLDQS